MNPRQTGNQTPQEYVARALHVVLGLLCLGLAGDVLLGAEVFNPYVFWGSTVAGIVLLSIGFFGSRKLVLSLLFCGGLQ